MPLDDAALRAMARPTLPQGFERRRLALPPGGIYRSDPDEWRGCVVIVESGTVDVHCREGGRESFGPGQILSLDWLPLESLRNPAPEEARLIAVRRIGRASG